MIYTDAELKTMGFSDAVVEAGAAMSHEKSVPYMEYVAALKRNRIAAIVKRADLLHNSDLSRLDSADDKALARVEKYRAALALLQE